MSSLVQRGGDFPQESLSRKLELGITDKQGAGVGVVVVVVVVGGSPHLTVI